MAYEFTKKKIADQRSALFKRVAIACVGGAAGFAVGIAINDMNSFFGMLSASVIGTFAGFATYYFQS